MERAMDKIKGSWYQVKGDLLEQYAALSVCDVLHVEDELYAREKAEQNKALDEMEDILGRLLNAGRSKATTQLGYRVKAA